MNIFFVSSETLHTCISDCQDYELTDRFTGKLLFPCSLEVMLLCKCEFSCVKISLACFEWNMDVYESFQVGSRWSFSESLNFSSSKFL